MREISKHPDCPALTKADVNLVTDLCFARREISIECLLVFGTSSDHAAFAARLRELHSRFRFDIVLTGGAPAYAGSRTPTDRSDFPESAKLLEALDSDAAIIGSIRLVEYTSSNTLDNIANIANFIDPAGYRSLGLMMQSHAAGRCRMTAERQLDTPMIDGLFPVDIRAGGAKLSAESWHCQPLHRQMVWSEVLRMDRYGRRGDIELGTRAKEIAGLLAKYGSSAE
jgi:DUF218 domain